MESTAENIRTGLRYKVADLILANRASEIPTLADENPMNWLGERPPNYLGELDSAPADEPKGQWYFDRRNRELVYTVNNRRHFSPSMYRDFSSYGKCGWYGKLRSVRQVLQTMGKLGAEGWYIGFNNTHMDHANSENFFLQNALVDTKGAHMSQLNALRKRAAYSDRAGEQISNPSPSGGGDLRLLPCNAGGAAKSRQSTAACVRRQRSPPQAIDTMRCRPPFAWRAQTLRSQRLQTAMQPAHKALHSTQH